MAATGTEEIGFEDDVWDDDDTTQGNKYMLFHIADEIFGIALTHITEIVEMPKITVVPDMPDFAKGVINLRGRIIPLMDLRLRFGLTEREYDDRTCIIIVRINETVVGVIVDTVAEVFDIPESDIDPPPTFEGAKAVRQCVAGLAKVDDRVAILVDVDQLLHGHELEALSGDEKSASSEATAK